MKFPQSLNFAGGRIVKTGIAVFITALVCHFLSWPAMFAVITAIVTIEPTASDSIKKAFVRFPATAIGTAFAVLFTFFFKDSALSYAFVAIATIITCNKLKLHAGTLVATITGAAMITTIHDQYLASFILRLASTLTGLIVSSLVNLLVLPPRYSAPISTGIRNQFQKTAIILGKRSMELIQVQTTDKGLRKEFQSLVKELYKIENLFHYQKAEWKFHKVKREDLRTYRLEYKKLTSLRRLTHHIGNLIYLPSLPPKMEQRKINLIVESVNSIKWALMDGSFSEEDQLRNIRDLNSWFYEIKSIQNVEELKTAHISSETAMLYELLSIYDLTIKLNQIQFMHQEKQLAIKERKYPKSKFSFRQSTSEAK